MQLRGYCSRRGYDRLDSLLNDLRLVYNAALEERMGADRQQGKSRSLYDQLNGLPQGRREDPDGFGQGHVSVARGAVSPLDRAMHAFSRRVKNGEKPGFLRLKSRGRLVTREMTPAGPRVLQPRGRSVPVTLNGVPNIPRRPSRSFPASKSLKAMRIVRRPPGCTVALVDAVEQEPLPASRAAIGRERGGRQRCPLSNGETLAPCKRDEARATALQPRSSRCRKGSHPRKKAVPHSARFRRREAGQHRTASLRLPTNLIQRFGLIVIEDLKSGKMLAVASAS